MDLKEIQTLIKFISSSKVDEVSIEQKDFKIKIRKNQTTVLQAQNTPMHILPQALPQVSESSSSVAAGAGFEKTQEDKASAAEDVIKSPMIGTFYRKSSPDKPSFVEVGDTIVKGQVICIIEAMKLFNEIEAEVSGKIMKVLVDDSNPVEYDQPLFVIEPS